MQAPRIQLAAGGPEFSRVVLGLWRLREWQLAPAQGLAMIEQARELGVTTLDQADIYGDYCGEALLGDMFKLAPGLRHKLEIVTKCGIKSISAQRPVHRIKHYDTGRAHLISSVDQSLANMRTDYLDLLLIHRPDPLMDADEVAEAFETLRKAGKVRHFGVSNFTSDQFELLAARTPIVTNQVEFSPMYLAPLHDGTLDLCQRLRIAPMAWSALAGGRLFIDTAPDAIRLRNTMDRIAEQHEVSSAAIAYAWIMLHPSKPLILTGSRRIALVRDAVQATQIELSREQWFEIWSAATGREVP